MSNTQKKRKPKRHVDPQIQARINKEKAQAAQLEKAKQKVVIFPSENKFQPRSSPFNAAVKARNVPNEIRNSYINYQHIQREFQQKKAQCVGTLMGKAGGPCLIIGSGPSFDDILPVLHKWEGAIICSPSHASTLVKWGNAPDVIVALDYRSDFPHGMYVDDWRKYPETKLFLHPCCNQHIVQAWKWSKYYYRTLKPEDEFYDRILPIAYPQIKVHMLVFSCSIPSQIGMAKLLGYEPIFLVGCDFSIYRFRKWEYKRQKAKIFGKELPLPWSKGEWIQAAKPGPDVTNLIQADNGQWSNRIQLFYKRSMFMGLRLDRLQTFSVIGENSKYSVIYEFPTVTIEELIRDQGWKLEHKYWTPEQMVRNLERYLCGQESFPIPMVYKGQADSEDADVHFIELDDPDKHLLPVLMKYREQFNLALDPEEKAKYLLGLRDEYQEKQKAMREAHGLDPEGKEERKVSSPLRRGGGDGSDGK